MARSTTTTRSVTFPRGFRAAGATCGIKQSGQPDLTLIVADAPCVAAGVFTTNKLPGAPIIVGKRHLRNGSLRAIVCNSGNANASTGTEGERNARQMCEMVAQHVGCDARQVLPSSTGIIGVQLPMDKLRRGIETAALRTASGAAADADAARGIMTTDLVPKSAKRTVKLPDKTVRIGGIAKGSGMIAPNMATMLCFITTDAAIEIDALRSALRAAAAASFNRISVDQHTSPSDSVIAMASGLAGNSAIRDGSEAHEKFTAALTDVCRDLAYKIVADGEGATRVMVVSVVNARSEKQADQIARAIVNSPLVKTAVHGGDPNWGRITTAAGYSGAAIRPATMSLSIGEKKPITVYERGTPIEHSDRTLKRLGRLMSGDEVHIRLDLGLGSAAVQWLGCDLSRQYIAINADYTT